MNIHEAKSGVKAIYLQAASLAGLEVDPDSPEGLVELLNEVHSKVEESRRPEAVANVLLVIAETLKDAQNKKDTQLHKSNVQSGREKVCPVYPFNG